MLALDVENLTKTYDKVQAVKGISFSVAEKEIFALIGPNGAGKSTTLKMLATILAPTSGKAEIYSLKRLERLSLNEPLRLFLDFTSPYLNYIVSSSVNLQQPIPS